VSWSETDSEWEMDQEEPCRKKEHWCKVPCEWLEDECGCEKKHEPKWDCRKEEPKHEKCRPPKECHDPWKHEKKCDKRKEEPEEPKWEKKEE